MPAIAAATITAPQMKRGGENHQAAVKIKITRQNFRRRGDIDGAMKLHHARAADAGPVLQLRRNACNKFFGDFHLGAPARAFIGGNSAKLAIIRLAAERAVFRLASGLN
jgi:hypothetical protein